MFDVIVCLVTMLLKLAERLWAALKNFEGKSYKQIDGHATRSPLGPILTNSYL